MAVDPQAMHAWLRRWRQLDGKPPQKTVVFVTRNVDGDHAGALIRRIIKWGFGLVVVSTDPAPEWLRACAGPYVCFATRVTTTLLQSLKGNEALITFTPECDSALKLELEDVVRLNGAPARP